VSAATLRFAGSIPLKADYYRRSLRFPRTSLCSFRIEEWCLVAIESDSCCS
jgi:hypothetical protein